MIAKKIYGWNWGGEDELEITLTWFSQLDQSKDNLNDCWKKSNDEIKREKKDKIKEKIKEKNVKRGKGLNWKREKLFDDFQGFLVVLGN
jgi:hypothetical protein